MWLCWICRRPNWKSSANDQSDDDNKDHKHAVQEVEILKRDQVGEKDQSSEIKENEQKTETKAKK
jgi:hypothetical protein